MAADYDGFYEASDEASENEMLEASLSKWKGFCYANEEDFFPIPVDIHTAASVGLYDCVQLALNRWVYGKTETKALHSVAVIDCCIPIIDSCISCYAMLQWQECG